MAYAFVQSVEGTRVTSGTTITATYTTQNVGAGNLLVAVVSRSVSSGSSASIGQVTDNQGNYWKQAVEYDQAVNLVGGTQGIDIWYCESAGGGNKPAVTATVLGSPNNAITGMNMQLLEYSGPSGRELVDQIGQANVTTTSVTVTTNFNLGASNDLAISCVSGNMSAATVPSGWTSRLADTTQKFWVADNVATGSSGSTVSAAWTSLTGATVGSGILVCFRQAGTQTSAGPTLLQSSYTDASFPSAASLTWTSQAYPVNPTAGNVLICFVTGIINGSVLGNYNSNLLSCHAQSITDTASNTWLPLAHSGVDNTSGVDWRLFICRSAKNSATTLTATFNQLATSAAFLLLEFKGLAPDLVIDQTASVASVNTSVSWTASTPNNVKAGSLALAIMSSLPAEVNHPASGWTQILSDTSGVGNAAMQLSTTAGGLTTTWSGGPFQSTDILLAALCSASGVGSH